MDRIVAIYYRKIDSFLIDNKLYYFIFTFIVFVGSQ